jgi:hypothetical protein
VLRRYFLHLVLLLLAAAALTAVVAQRAILRGRAPLVPVAALQHPPEPLESLALEPDRRALLAVADLDHLLTGTPWEEASVRASGAGWQVLHRGVEVGTLPALPGYRDLMSLLESWAARLSVTAVVDAPGLSGDPAPLEAELGRLRARRAAAIADRRWGVGERGRALLALGTRAVVWLELENGDRVGASDRLAGRAMALLAACQALDSTALARESCLLAFRLGYGAEAASLADALDPYDPVRAYVCGHDQRLTAIATRRGAALEARYLRLLAAAEVGDADTWDRALDPRLAADDDLALALLGGRLALNDESPGPACLATLRAVSRDLAVPDPAPGPAGEGAAPGMPIADFERLMSSLPADDGFFLDREVLSGYYRGAFYSALLAGDPPRDAATASGEPAAEFGRWAAHIAAAAAGHPDRTVLTNDLATLPHFGAPLLAATWQALAGEVPSPEPALRRAAARLARRLDSRPEHRALLGALAWRNLLLLEPAEALLASAADCGASDDTATGWWAGLVADRGRLEALLARPGRPAEAVAALLGHYQNLPGLDSAAVCRAYRRASAAHPDSWSLTAGAAGYLERQRAWLAARSEVHRWLDRNADRAGVESIEARVTLARLWEDEGRYAEGFAAVASAVQTQHGEAMLEAARLLEFLRRPAQAETLAAFAAEHGPGDGAARALAAELFWRHGEPGSAARQIGPTPAAGADGAQRLGDAFVSCFRSRVAAGALAADSLLGSGVPSETIAALASAAADSGAWNLTLEVEARVRPRPGERLAHLLRTYRAERHVRDTAQAEAHLEQSLAGSAPAERMTLARLAFAAGEDGLLWSDATGAVVSATDEGWLLRAAAAARSGDHGGAHAHDLAWHFAAPDTAWERVLGRFMLGLEDERRLASLGPGAAQRCEVCYYAGLKADLDARLRDAAGWYGRCLATHQSRRAEYGWAYRRLLEWQRLGVSLERLAAAAVRAPA